MKNGDLYTELETPLPYLFDMIFKDKYLVVWKHKTELIEEEIEDPVFYTDFFQED